MRLHVDSRNRLMPLFNRQVPGLLEGMGDDPPDRGVSRHATTAWKDPWRGLTRMLLVICHFLRRSASTGVILRETLDPWALPAGGAGDGLPPCASPACSAAGVQARVRTRRGRRRRG